MVGILRLIDGAPGFLPVPRSLRVSRTLFFTMTWQSPCRAPSRIAADRFTPFFGFIVFELAFCCLLWYWLGFYRILQRLPFVSPNISQLHDVAEITCRVRSWPTSPSLFTWQSVTMSLVFQYQVGVFQVMQTYPSLITSGAFPFGRSTCVLSAFAPRPAGHLDPTPLHSLGGCNVVWLVSF